MKTKTPKLKEPPLAMYWSRAELREIAIRKFIEKFGREYVDLPTMIDGSGKVGLHTFTRFRLVDLLQELIK